MEELTGLQRDMLYAIAGLNQPHGLAVKRELEEYYDKELHEGRLYPNLQTLVDRGLVDKSQRDKRTNEYVLSEKAKELLSSRRGWETQFVNGKLTV